MKKARGTRKEEGRQRAEGFYEGIRNKVRSLTTLSELPTLPSLPTP